ncbi:MAG TPA: hypothetical protein VFN67_24285 [Polyangiales bacterium]|nr:hypothetical protein [Polyangiales bacterium]
MEARFVWIAPALYALMLALWPALPMQDASAWVFEASLLHQKLAGHAASGCSLVDALPPNAFAQLTIADLQSVLPAELAGRLYMMLCVGGLFASLVYLRVRGLALLAILPLCAGYPLYHGFLNYMAALPVLGFGLGGLLRNPEARGARGLALLLVVPTVLYTCHGTVLAVWGLLVLVQCWVRRSWQLLARAAVGFVPVLCLLALYVLQRNAEGAGVTWSAGSLLATISYRLRSPLRFFSVFHGLAPTYDDVSLRAVAPVCAVLNVVYGVWLCASGVTWAVRARTSARLDERFLALSTLALCVCFLVLPHDVAKMLNPAERLLLPAAMIGAAGASLRPRMPQRWGVVLYALLALQLVYVGVWGTRAATAAESLIAARKRFGFDAPVVQARQLRFAGAAPSLGAVDLLPRHQVLAMQGMLEEFRAGHLVAPFDTGLFRCHLEDQVNPTGWDLAEFCRHERPLIVLGEKEHVGAVTDQLGPDWRTLQVGTGFNVVQRTAAQP